MLLLFPASDFSLPSGSDDENMGEVGETGEVGVVVPDGECGGESDGGDGDGGDGGELK